MFPEWNCEDYRDKRKQKTKKKKKQQQKNKTKKKKTQKTLGCIAINPL